MKKIILSIIAVCSLSTILFVFGLGLANGQKIVRGVSIGGIVVGGMKSGEARMLLDDKIKDFLSQDVIVIVDGRDYKTKVSQLGVDVDSKKSVELAMSIGRNGNFIANIIKQTKSLIFGFSADMKVSVLDSKLEEYLNEFKDYETSLAEASMYFDDSAGNFKIQPSKNGKIIDREDLRSNLISMTRNLGERNVAIVFNIDIHFKDVAPKFTDVLAESARLQAEELLDQHSGIDFAYNGSGLWSVDKKIIGGWIIADLSDDKKLAIVSFSNNKISDYLTQISQNINQEPVDAVLTQKDGRVQEFTLSRDGRYINIPESSREILEALKNYDKQATLVTDSTRAKISIDNIENLGLTSLLATGSSDFAGSPANRVHNIKVGASKFNGYLLAMGEEFSFVKILGEVGSAEGYLPELVIKNNSVTPEYGGGICQVSTTAFRGAVYAGLEIKERYPHSFPIKYYNPQGFDAAIYPPSPDLKFVNNTPSNILIQTRIKGTKIYFEFYGTDDGRKVVLTGPEEYDKQPDGSMKTRLTREIFDKDGNSIKKTVFRSSYRSPSLYPVKNPLE